MSDDIETIPECQTEKTFRRSIRSAANSASKGIEKTLSKIPKHYRAKVYLEYDKSGWPRSPLTQENKPALADAIFKVEDAYEHKLGSRHPATVALRSARNVLYDALGWNEYNKWRKAGYTWETGADGLKHWVAPRGG